MTVVVFEGFWKIFFWFDESISEIHFVETNIAKFARNWQYQGLGSESSETRLTWHLTIYKEPWFVWPLKFVASCLVINGMKKQSQATTTWWLFVLKEAGQLSVLKIWGKLNQNNDF